MPCIQAIAATFGQPITPAEHLEVCDLLSLHYPGVAVRNIPPAAWQWIFRGEGRAPWDAQTSMSATSLMGLFDEMDSEQRGQLLANAAALVYDEMPA